MYTIKVEVHTFREVHDFLKLATLGSHGCSSDLCLRVDSSSSLVKSGICWFTGRLLGGDIGEEITRDWNDGWDDSVDC